VPVWVGPHLPHDVKAGPVGKLHVREDQVYRLVVPDSLAEQGEGTPNPVCDKHGAVEPEILECHPNELCQGGVIFYVQDS